jgi:DNA-directed RNA polymerase subunit E'/Rpb7
MELTTHLHLSAEVKNTWRYTSSPPYILVKHADSINFTFNNVVRFRVIKAVITRSKVSQDVTTCSMAESCQRFGGMCCRHLQV